MKNLAYLFFALFMFSCSQSYEYTSTEGATSPEELLKTVIEAAKTGNAETMGKVILNYDMEALKQIESTKEGLAKAQESGDAETISNYEKALKMFESKDYYERLSDMQAKFGEKSSQEVTDTKMMFENYANLETLSLDDLYVKDGLKDPETHKFVGVNFMGTDSTDYYLQINAEKINDRWYYDGQKSAGKK